MAFTESVKLRLEGESPLLMHNGQLADPLNEIARAMKLVTSKRKKTDDDHAELARLEWLGGLYLNEDERPVLPSSVIEATLCNAAKKRKLGKVALAALMVEEDAVLEYDGPVTPDELWNEGNHRLTVGVRVQQNRVQRTRPKFDDWAAEVEVTFDPEQINKGDLLDIARIAGENIGIGDWRPKFGRFSVEEV